MQIPKINPIQNYVIVGGGTAGWMTAAILAHSLKHLKVNISLIEAPDIPTIGVGEATIPSFVDLLAFLRIPLKDFIKNTDSTFKLAIKFENWRQNNHNYWHPFGKIGNQIDGLDFYQHWLNHYAQQGQFQFTDFSPAVHLAEQNRFYAPRPGEKSNLSASAFALHFNAALVADYLKSYSLNLGVTHISDRVEQVNLSPSGTIKDLTLKQHGNLSGDFYFDCSGQAAVLINKALRVGYQDWQEYLPVDTAIALQSKAHQAPRPYTRAIAQPSGWCWQIPLQSRTGNGYVFSRDFTSPEQASDHLVEQLGEQNCLTEPRQVRFRTGKRNKIWYKNCLSVGLSSGFLEPLESTSIHLIMKAVLNFVQSLPDKNLSEATTNEYNRRMDSEYLNIRDFIIAHYCLSERTDSEFWRCWQHAVIPDSLQQKLALFKNYGRLQHNPDDLFATDSWYAVLTGMGLMPTGQDPLVARSNTNMIEGALKDSYQALHRSAAEKLSHADYLAALLNKQ
ncbi:tryptophan halogenase family protein [Gayadomonas joobiniege]|uniref:tryptophan halogenase family protein n=1 Tax=Gayadomonas joobiniege TaxID=1234606 RepID=UPI00037ABFDF|nr:tryptophan halogenase family protein [Gayadomonas joobiniege]